MSTDPMVEHSRIPRDWERPFVGAFSSHTANFLSVQVALWARVSMCTDLSFDTKLKALYYSNWVAILIVLIGFVGTVPYTLSVFREREVAVGSGPSLISELIPQWMTSGFLIFAFFVLEVADYLISTQFRLTSAKWLYLGLALAGVVMAIISPDELNSRILVSSTVFYICVQEPAWFMDWSVVGPVASAVVLSCLFDAFRVKQNRNILRPLETEIIRIRIICKILLCLCLTVSFFAEFAILLIIGNIFCNLLAYHQERRYGSLLERRCLREVPGGSYSDQP